jgi:hypothetical protein
MEFADVALPPFAFRSAPGSRGGCEYFISTIYSTASSAMTASISSRPGDEVAGTRFFLQGAQRIAANGKTGRASWHGRKEMHDDKD